MTNAAIERLAAMGVAAIAIIAAASVAVASIRADKTKYHIGPILGTVVSILIVYFAYKALVFGHIWR